MFGSQRQKINRQKINRSAFDAKQLLRPGAIRVYQSLTERASWDRERIGEFAGREADALIRHAIEHSPFYRQSSRGRLPQISQMPILTRQDIVKSFDSIAIPESKRHGRLASTGGTSGRPVSVLLDNRSHPEALTWRMLRSWGLHPGDDMAIINRQTRSARSEILNWAMWYPTRHMLLDAAMMDRESMERFAKLAKSHQPRLIVGYAGAILEFADFLLRERIEIPVPELVWVTASPLTDAQRDLIRAAFKADVFDQYGSTEVNLIAAECRYHCGLHIQSDCRIVEIVDDLDEPVAEGTWGRVLITDLLNRVFPLIRYEVGDIGRLLTGECPCGSPFPRMDSIRGRVSDAFRFADGSIIGGEYLTTIFDNAPLAVKQFRVHQVTLDHVNLVCVPSSHPESARQIEDVARGLRRRIGNRAAVTVEVVEDIPHQRGKERFVISDVS